MSESYEIAASKDEKGLSAYKKETDQLPSSKQSTQGNSERKAVVKPFLIGFAIGVALCFLALFSAFSLGFFTASNIDETIVEDEPAITDVFISGKLENASEVISGKYIFSGIKDYEEGNLPIINRSKFSMYYTATVRAGIDNASEIREEINEDDVVITLPAARIIDVHIHPNSLRYFDKEDPLIHPNDREQVAKLLEIAEEDAKAADMSELLDLADEQLEHVVAGILKDSIGDYNLIIKHSRRTTSTAENAIVDSKGDTY